MENIARYRKERALTQRELAERIGVTRRTLARWESGKVKPRPRHLVALADELRCDVIELEGIETLSDARRAAGHTQKTFSQATGIPQGSLANIETGRAPIPDTSSWARALGRTTMEIEQLAGGVIDARHQLLLEGVN